MAKQFLQKLMYSSEGYRLTAINIKMAMVMVLIFLSGAAGQNKIINEAEIVGEFEGGSEKVKVIVNLIKPEMLVKKTLGQQSHDAMKQLHAEIKERQDKVMGALAKDEFEVRHQFENQAGFSCEVTTDGLNKLLNDPAVESVEPVYILEEHLAQGIPLINGIIYRTAYNGQGNCNRDLRFRGRL